MSTEARVAKHLAIVVEQARAIAAPDPVGALPALFAYEAQTREALVTALARDPKCLPVCAPGCAYCCHLVVLASVPEVLHLAAHLRATRTNAEIAALTASLRARADHVRGMDAHARAEAQTPCLLLDRETGKCTVYEARPFSCRAYNSCDANVCKQAFDAKSRSWDLPVDLFQLTVTRNVREGLLEATRASSREPGPYDLMVALAIALENEDAEARYRAGEPIFDEAETLLAKERRAIT